MTDTIDSTTQQENIEAAPVAPSIALQDLILLAQIVQQTSIRGGFRAEELETVGGVYARLVAFLEANGAVNRIAEQQAEESVTEEGSDGNA